MLKLHEHWAYQHCDVLVCISRALAQRLIKETGVAPRKIIVVPNGVDVAHLSPDGQTPRRYFTDPTRGFVGHLQQWQRLDLLLDALAALRADGIAFSLVVVGDGSMRAAWENLAAHMELVDRVRFVGHLFDPDQRESLVRALHQAYAERDRWQQMGRRGREVIVARHSWEARVRTMIGQIEVILQDKYGTAYPARRRG